MSLEILPIVATIKKNITTKQVFGLINCDYTMLNKKSKTFKANVTREQLKTLIQSGYLIDIIEDEPSLEGPIRSELCDSGTQSISYPPYMAKSAQETNEETTLVPLDGIPERERT